MSSKTKSKKNSNTHYYGCVYGGIMKQGYVCFFTTTEDPEEYFLQFKGWYGSKVRGRFVKASDEEEYLEKLEEKLKEHNVHGKIYEVSVDTASKTLKELTGAKKTSLLGEDESTVNHDENKVAKSEPDHDAIKDEKKVKVSKSEPDHDATKDEKKVKVSKSEDEKPASKKEEKKTESKDDKKVAVSKTTKKAKAVESENESSDEDEQPSEAESEPEDKQATKASSKKDVKKDTKAKSSK
jgi:hypothetical protein